MQYIVCYDSVHKREIVKGKKGKRSFPFKVLPRFGGSGQGMGQRPATFMLSIVFLKKIVMISIKIQYIYEVNGTFTFKF